MTHLDGRHTQHAKHTAQIDRAAHPESPPQGEAPAPLACQELAAVAHEVRQRLAVAVGFAALLATAPADGATTRHYAHTIHDGGQRTEKLLQDLLTLEDIARGRFTVVPRPLSLGSTIQDAVRRATAGSASHVFDIDVPRDLPLVLADPELLARVLDNLLSNAMKYSPPGSPVTVAAHAPTTDNTGANGTSAATIATGDTDTTSAPYPCAAMVQVQVIDRGPGIPEAQLPHLFTPFYRLPGATSGIGPTSGTCRPPGTGLGLPIVKDIVTRHGGTVYVESCPGRGTTVTVTLPTAPAS